ncbi:NAD(P)/FAD-dependent oxidoreductase [Prauserella oleivorans]|uniref:NAD(P)/FAD-dependent oxidoreductase n=1 Tax=Prauserella oleivorans TaxID=1478153 RepID=A0ABW5WAG1_9PSEU
MTDAYRPPGHVVVVGAGIVGLSTAHFLRRHDVAVTVLERRQVASGASWGNAGWLSPALAVPLPEPATLRAGLSGFMTPSAPLYVPPDPRLVPFLTSLARHSTRRHWQASLAALTPLNRAALDAHAALAAEGVTSEPMEPCLIATRAPEQRESIVDELRHVHAAGQPVEFELLDGAAAREAVPLLSEEVGYALQVHGQRYIDPGRYVGALGAAVRRAGVRIEEGAEVRSVHDTGTGVELRMRAGDAVRADAVVLAPGASLDRLARPFGVHRRVQAGRGYSFSVVPERMPPGPVYFPAEKVVFTPLGERLRVSGMMEFRPADAPLSRSRIASIVHAARPLVRGIDWASRADEWVGARPCTADGLPLIGPTLSPRVHVAGGHGMWGVTQGPATGLLLAETIATGVPRPELAALHPLR